MVFQNEKDLKSLEAICPPVDFVSKDFVALRWTFSEMEHPENFKSQYHKKPNRFKNSTAIKKCIAMSLSMFNTAKNAKKRFTALKKSMGDFAAYETLGTHIAKGNLIEEDGVHSEADKRGHLSFFPSKRANLSNSFAIIEKLE